MESSKISFNHSQSFIEPALFVTVALFAGSSRLIQYFPDATKGGMLLAGTTAGAACYTHDYLYDGEEFLIARKLAAIIGASVISSAMTHALKGSVYLPLMDHVKVISVGTAITLAKNAVEYLPAKETPPPPPPPPPADGKITPLEGATVSVKIKAGTSNCTNYKNGPPGVPGTITLKDNVYAVDYGGYCTAFLMLEEDFSTLRNMSHGGAFGGDYRRLNASELTQYGLKGSEKKSYMLLWKIPADLKGIENYVVDPSKVYEPYYVGNYWLGADKSPASDKISEDTRQILASLQRQSGIKIRSDFSETKPPLSSTHYLKLTSEDVPGISTCFFFRNFNSPKAAELEKVQTLLDALAELNIGAYLCNSSQHMLIIGAYDNQKITPEGLATLFDEDDILTEAILGALKAAAIPLWEGSVDHWKEFYITRHGDS